MFAWKVKVILLNTRLLIDKKYTYFCLLVCFFSLFAVTNTVFGSSEDNEESSEPAAVDLRDLLQIQPLNIPELAGELTIDGVLDEPLWEQAARYEITLETYPALLEPSPVKTDVWFGRVEDDLVVGFVAHDPDPDKIQAPLRGRDSIELDDYVGFSVDLAGKFMSTYEFYVNASGVQGDWVRNRVDDTRMRDWDADWVSAANIGSHGYTVEMRIPLSELEIPTAEEGQKRFLLFKRHYPREIRHHLAVITTKEVKIRKKPPGKRLAVIPSISLLNEWSRDPVDDTYWEKENKSEFSLDVGYKITPSLGLLATFNPNFLEVEADLTDWSINDPFTPLLVEKRPFFTKGTETFGTPFDLVYTRNIENPDGGIKVAGIVSDLTTGNFIVNDSELSLIVPGNLSSEEVDLESYSSSGAFRSRYDFNPGMSAGIIGTARTDNEDYYNVVAGADIYTKLNQTNEIWAQWVYSGTEYPDEIVNELCEEDGGCDDPEDTTGLPGKTPLNEQVLRADPDRTYNDDALHLKYKYNRREGYFTARYLDVGEDFRADLGYLPRVDQRLVTLSGGLNHYINIEDKGQVRFLLSANYLRMESQAGDLINESREIWLNHWGLYQSWLRIGYRNRVRTARRFLQNTLEIDGNSQEFTENQLEFRFESSGMKNSRFILAGKVGQQIDTDNYRLGDIIEIKPELRWHITDQFELGLRNTYRQLDVDGGRLFSENYLGLHLIYHFLKGSFLRFTVIDDYLRRDQDLYLFEEVDHLDRETTMELLYVWKPTQLNTIFIGAKSGAIHTDELNDPALDAASFYMKFSRAFRF